MILSTITCSNEVRSCSLEIDQFSKHSCQSIKMGYSSHVSVYEVKMLRWDLLQNLISFSFILVLSLVPGKIGYGPGKPQGPGTGRGLVSLLITRIPENFKAVQLRQ